MKYIFILKVLGTPSLDLSPALGHGGRGHPLPAEHLKPSSPLPSHDQVKREPRHCTDMQ